MLFLHRTRKIAKKYNIHILVVKNTMLTSKLMVTFMQNFFLAKLILIHLTVKVTRIYYANLIFIKRLLPFFIFPILLTKNLFLAKGYMLVILSFPKTLFLAILGWKLIIFIKTIIIFIKTIISTNNISMLTTGMKALVFVWFLTKTIALKTLYITLMILNITFMLIFGMLF